MSFVTLNVPYAPQPFACMRRSGITSRSNCAIFSISQMSWSSAGPRAPAVMMLVLSATGAPVALVNTRALDMGGSFGRDDERDETGQLGQADDRMTWQKL